jgi:nucleotide sugar dehydrogenase
MNPETASGNPSTVAGTRIASTAVIGLGYVGLPTALALLGAGRRVVGLDRSERRLEDVRRGRVDLSAADRDLLSAHLGREALELTADPAALAGVDAVLVCAPTPVDGRLVPDRSALEAACAAAVAHARPGQTLVLTSTSNVGTTRELLAGPLLARGLRPGRDVFVACAPERINPGGPVPASAGARVVGGVTAECGRRAAAALAPTAAGAHLVGSPEAAEMTKLVENTFRAVNIALANEFATVCGHLGLEAVEVVEAAATKPFGYMPFYPGPGAGGHCIPCDPHYLLWQLRGQGLPTPVIDSAMAAIAERPHAVVRRVREVLADRGTPLRGARVLVLGATYKPGVADVRESPALTVLDRLRGAGALAAYYDPLVPALTVGGERLAREPKPWQREWDLVVVHTVHPGQDLSWIGDQVPVLDTTYRHAGTGDRSTL